MVMALEPSEAFRVLGVYGNPASLLIWNTRPVYPVSVICGEKTYPGQNELLEGLEAMTARNWSLNATAKAMDLGNAIFANIIMLGALAFLELLPFNRKDFTDVLAATLPPDKMEINLTAFDSAADLMQVCMAAPDTVQQSPCANTGRLKRSNAQQCTRPIRPSNAISGWNLTILETSIAIRQRAEARSLSSESGKEK